MLSFLVASLENGLRQVSKPRRRRIPICAPQYSGIGRAHKSVAPEPTNLPGHSRRPPASRADPVKAPTQATIYFFNNDLRTTDRVLAGPRRVAITAATEPGQANREACSALSTRRMLSHHHHNPHGLSRPAPGRQSPEHPDQRQITCSGGSGKGNNAHSTTRQRRRDKLSASRRACCRRKNDRGQDSFRGANAVSSNAHTDHGRTPSPSRGGLGWGWGDHAWKGRLFSPSPSQHFQSQTSLSRPSP
jgi:hypothetical protein